MKICARRQTNASKQTALLDGGGVGPPKHCVFGRGLNRSVHEAMSNILNVKFHLKTRSGNTSTFLLLFQRKLSSVLEWEYHPLNCCACGLNFGLGSLYVCEQKRLW